MRNSRVLFRHKSLVSRFKLWRASCRDSSIWMSLASSFSKSASVCCCRCDYYCSCCFSSSSTKDGEVNRNYIKTRVSCNFSCCLRQKLFLLLRILDLGSRETLYPSILRFGLFPNSWLANDFARLLSASMSVGSFMIEDGALQKNCRMVGTPILCL